MRGGRVRRLRPRAAALVVALFSGAALLAGCALPDDPPPDVAVTGDSGAAPTITYVTPLTVDEPFRKVLWEGAGPEVVDGQPILLDYWLENATDATLVRESYSSNPTSQLLSQEDLGAALYETIKGHRVGARLLQVVPAEGDTSATSYPTVAVVDILPTRADGQAVTPAEGLPAVRLDDTGAPSITPVKGEPPVDLVVQPLQRGPGRQVVGTDTVTVQYTGWNWAGEEFDTTWNSSLPISFSLQDVPAWSEALVDQTVGSQVLLIVPPKYNLGVTQSEELSGQTVVFVVDILDARSPDEAPPAN